MRGKKTGGRQKGTLNKNTLEKEAYREQVRARLSAVLEEIDQSLISRAKGVRYFITRNKKTGKYELVTNPERVVKALNGEDEESGEFYTDKPDTQAIREIYDRTIDRPKDQAQEVQISGRLTLEDAILASRKKPE